MIFLTILLVRNLSTLYIVVGEFDLSLLVNTFSGSSLPNTTRKILFIYQF